MPFSTLVRNKEPVLKALYQDPTGSLIAKQDLKIIFPVRYEEANLAAIEGSVYVLGIFAIQVGNEYAVNSVPARIRLHPTDIERVKYNNADYYVLSFDRGGIITDNINVVKENTLGYYIYNYFVALGKVPWFMGAEDMLGLFDNMTEYTGEKYGVSPMITKMIISMIMRNPDDIQEYWRQSINTQDDITSSKPDFIPLANVPFGARNTTAKLMGSYFDEGLNSALLHPSETTEKVEELLRQ